MGKKKDKKKKEEAAQPQKVQRTVRAQKEKVKNYPCKLTVKNPATSKPWEDYKAELHPDSIVTFQIEGKTFEFRLNDKNKAIEITSLNDHCYLQPLSIRTFLIK
jgi:Fic family protein